MTPKDLDQRPIADLTPYARNSRTHSEAQVAQIAASIREFGFTNPVLVDAEGGIIAGHGRVLAAQSLGLETVPVLVLDHLSEDQRRAYVIADNKLAMNAGWDDDALRAEIEELARGGYGLDVIGFDAGELEGLLAQPTALDEMPPLRDGERQPFQTMTFTLHDDQVATVRAAMSTAGLASAYSGSQNANGNGNALARICEDYQARHGDS
jgi:ParB-like chromosome segregation protein Spo0J